jgi:hypothetical protein
MIDQSEFRFEKDLSGGLTKEGFLNLRLLIGDFLRKEFKPIKEKLYNRRI